MKKLTTSVAALSIAMMSYGQCANNYEDSVKITKFQLDEIVNTAEDIILSMILDVENGKIYQEYADMYIENLQNVIAIIRKEE